MRVSLECVLHVNLVLKKKTAFGFEKKTTAEVGFLGSISRTRRMRIYEHWTTGAGWGGGGEAPVLFYGKRVLAILKTCSTGLEIRNCLRMFTNL